MRRLALIAAAAVVAGTAPAQAWAHAALLRTEPAAGAVLERSPGSVTLRFTEPIDTALAEVRVLDAKLVPVRTGTLVRPRPDAIVVSLPSLGEGTYVVAWRVVSEDTHPIHGTFTFSVGAPSAGAKDVATRASEAQETPESVERTFAAVRFVSFALLLFCVGGAFLLAFVGGLPRRLEPILAGAAVALAPVSVAGIVCQAADGRAVGFGTALDADLLSDVLDTRFGQAWGIRAGLGLVLAGVALVGARARFLAAAVALALVPTASFAAHAGTEGALTTAADLAHVLAASIWTGGLVFVFLALVLVDASARWLLAARVVPRFSAVALAAVVVLVAAGALNAFLEIRTWHALWDTTYGKLVLVKSALFVPVLALGAYNNRFAVPRLRNELSSRSERRRFVRAISMEIALLAAIVAVTSALVAEPPGKSVAAQSAAGTNAARAQAARQSSQAPRSTTSCASTSNLTRVSAFRNALSRRSSTNASTLPQSVQTRWWWCSDGSTRSYIAASPATSSRWTRPAASRSSKAR